MRSPPIDAALCLASRSLMRRMVAAFRSYPGSGRRGDLGEGALAIAHFRIRIET
jgi:hypothetical protein